MTILSVSSSQIGLGSCAASVGETASSDMQSSLADTPNAVTENVNLSSWHRFSTVAKTLDEQNEMFHEKDAKYNLAPHDATQDAMTTVTKELGKVQKVIELLQPGLSYKSWDFTLRDGQLEATGDKLTQKEKQWLTNVLNLDEKLVDASKKYYGAVVTYFENTADHTDPVSTYSSYSSTRRYAYNVAEQINGKLPIKQMLIDLQSRSSTKGSNYKNTLDDARHYLTFSTEDKFHAEEYRALIGRAFRHENGEMIEVSPEEYFASDEFQRDVKGG